MIFPEITWANALRLLVDAFVIGFGWSAGCWLFGRLVGAIFK